MSKTYNALLARGVNSILAKRLSDNKFTISKLKTLTKEELTVLGLNEEECSIILSEERPPIPVETVIKLLYESKWTCSVCRDKTKGVVIHHINEWNQTKDHSEENLVVLCSEHHDLAHTKKELTLNLTKSRLKAIKKKWLDDVKLNDTNTILGLTNGSNSRWDYFNHNRIFEIYLDRTISNKNFKTTFTVEQLGLINSLGTFSINDSDKTQIYSFGDGYMLYYYMKELFDSVLQTIPLIDLTDKFSRIEIKSLVNPGFVVAIQAAFYFKHLSKINRGKGQTRLCYYKKNHIKIQFEFDAYESTSNSAWGTHLAGRKVITSIGYVTSIVEENDYLTITISCLALGCFLQEHEHRKNMYQFIEEIDD